MWKSKANGKVEEKEEEEEAEKPLKTWNKMKMNADDGGARPHTYTHTLSRLY